MRKKQKLVFTIIFGLMPFLFFHAFILSMYWYRNALEIPIFVVFPLMLVCFDVIGKYMPSDLHGVLQGKSEKNKKSVSLKRAIFDVAFWYGIVIFIYYHFPSELWKNEDYASLAAIGGGYLSFFILTAIGGFVVVYLVESYKLIHKSLIPGSVSLLAKKLGGVFISYLGVALLFSAIYRILNIYIDGSFNQKFESSIDSIYFSVVTITTLGYGDILPVHWLSKVLVIIEVLVGVMFLAVMIGLIISTSLDNKDQSESNKKSMVE